MSGVWKGEKFVQYPYKKFQDEKVAEIAREKNILDIGGGDHYQKWLQQYRPLFANSNYKTIDPDPSTKPDVVGNIHDIPLPDASVDAIICYSVLEHVRNPLKAVSEMRRVLCPGGKILLYVPSIYPYHARKGHYPDYWRFFDDTLLMMFENWSECELQKVGGYFRALFFFVPFQHRLRFLLDPLSYALDWLLGTMYRTTTSGYILYAKK
jgi:SAM-dependent methyltransferase